MKPTSKPIEKTARGFDAQTFWRHYVATVDTGQEWEQERPQQGSGSNRLFLFLLLFHIFLIGSVVLFNLVAERPKPVFVDNSVPSKITPATAKKAPAPEKSTPGTPVITATKQGETVEHRVAQGDSLKSIAAASGVTQEEIARINHIDLNMELAVGSVLQVPKPKAKAVPAVVPVGVQPSRIDEKITAVQSTTVPASARIFTAVEPAPMAKRTEMAPAQERKENIASAPPEDKTKAKVEHSPPAARPKATTTTTTTAKIEDAPPAPKPKPATKVEDSPPPSKPKPTETKAVAKTDTTVKPAETPKPAEAAKLASSSASSKPAASGTTHKVKANETFYSISRKYGVKLDDLMRLNSSVNPNKMREGMVLKVPGK